MHQMLKMQMRVFADAKVADCGQIGQERSKNGGYREKGKR